MFRKVVTCNELFSHYHNGLGKVREWFNLPAWKVGVRLGEPWVRIPPFPPVLTNLGTNLLIFREF